MLSFFRAHVLCKGREYSFLNMDPDRSHALSLCRLSTHTLSVHIASLCRAKVHELSSTDIPILNYHV